MPTKKQRVKEKERRQRRRQQIEAVRDSQDERLEKDVLEESDTPEVEDETEELEKDMGMMDGYFGPTSFDEVDAIREASDRAQEVRQVTWTVQDLVWNILNNPLSDPKEKKKQIQSVATDFEQRVTQALAPMKKDMELLQLETLLAVDARHTGMFEKAGDFIKEKLSTGSRDSLSDESFALVYKDGDKTVRKYPIHDKAHVRNALARAAQQMKDGGAGAEDARKALPKIKAAAKKFGIDMSMEKGILIEKDAKGDWRWIGSPTNNFIDWQKDILSKQAHKNYVDWLDKNPEFAPVFMSWHTPGTQREHPVDFWMEQDGAVIMSGILTEDEAAGLLAVQKSTDLGMSHQAFGVRGDKSDPRVVTDYWIYEVSDLPLEKAANPFTTFETMVKEADMNKLEYLAQLMGSEEKAKSFLEKTGQVQKDLKEAGVTSKERGEEAPVEGASKAETPATSAAAPVDMDAIVKAIGEKFDIDGLNAFVAQARENIEKIGVLEEVVKSLQASTEDRLVEALTPPVSRFAWSQQKRASQSDATKLKKDAEEDKTLGETAPGVPEDYWLSKATHTVPIPVD